MTEASIRNKPGMASVKDMPLLLDGPPPGNFAQVRYARRIPSKGTSAIAIFLAAFRTFSWGMYHVSKGNKIRRILSWFAETVAHLEENIGFGSLVMVLSLCVLVYALDKPIVTM